MLTIDEIKALCAAGNIVYEVGSYNRWVCQLRGELMTALGVGDTEQEASNAALERYLRMVSGGD